MANPNFQENKVKRMIAKTIQPILRVLNKRLYVSWQYRYITGRKLQWKTLSTYTEKLQFLRLYVYPKQPEVIEAASRVGARKVVERHNLGDILIPIYGVYQHFDDIDFTK